MKQRDLQVGDRVRVYMPGYQPKDGYIKEKYLGPYYIARVVIDKEYGEERDWQVYPQQCRRLKKKEKKVPRMSFKIIEIEIDGITFNEESLFELGEERLCKAWCQMNSFMAPTALHIDRKLENNELDALFEMVRRMTTKEKRLAMWNGEWMKSQRSSK